MALIELAIGRDTKERKKFSARTTKPKPSATDYQVEERYGKIAAYVRLFPQNGTHSSAAGPSHVDRSSHSRG
jgi:23S rRNA pseudouridine1911/1915/1917 synthase